MLSLNTVDKLISFADDIAILYSQYRLKNRFSVCTLKTRRDKKKISTVYILQLIENHNSNQFFEYRNRVTQSTFKKNILKG